MNQSTRYQLKKNNRLTEFRCNKCNSRLKVEKGQFDNHLYCVKCFSHNGTYTTENGDCCIKPNFIFVKQLIADGRFQLRTMCTHCLKKSSNSIPHKECPNMEELPIFNFMDYYDIKHIRNTERDNLVIAIRDLRTQKHGIITDNSKWLNSVFIDMSYTPYKLTGSSNPNNTGFYNFNINLGGQFGLITNTEIGLFGVTFNPQLNYISAYEEKNNGSSLEELIHDNNMISREYLGAGLKINIAINDFSIFFETRKYFPLNTSYSVPGLNDRVIFSIGGVATGTAFKTKTKETSDR